MKFRHSLTATLWAAGALGFLAPAARAQDPLTVQTSHAATYLNGGVGQDERAQMKRQAAGYPLHISFSEGASGEFLADIPVQITDAAGHTVFELPKAGPKLYVALPPGTYQVQARWNDAPESRQVTIAGTGTQDVNLRWSGKPGS